MLWKISYLEWRKGVLSYFEESKKFISSPKSYAITSSKCPLLWNLVINLADHAFLYETIKSHKPTLVYAGAKHTATISSVLKDYFGYTLKKVIPMDENLSPISQEAIAEALEILAQPISKDIGFINKIRDWSEGTNFFLRNLMEEHNVENLQALLEKLEQQYRTLVTEQELE
jgi:hypothetical protein